jgi:amino acid adenylation domain-containing protein
VTKIFQTPAEREASLQKAKAASLQRRSIDLAPIHAGQHGPSVPLSFAQQRLWFLEQLGGAGRAYHLPASLRLRGELHQDALVRALDRIVERHEVLRTTFHSVDGEPEQRIAPAGESRFHLTLHDLGGRPEGELQALMEEEAGAPFDLEHGPLIRGRLVKLGEDDHVLLVTMHHVVSDGWSVGVLVRELSTLYGAFQQGREDPLPPLAVQYADYAAWQRRWVDGEVLRQQAEYWKQTLAGAPELLELPTDRPRPRQQDHAGAAAELVLDEELTAGLKALSQRHGTTLFMTLLAGWAVVLSRLSGRDEVVIGTPTANRGRPEIKGLIGFFVNTLALRVDLTGAPTVAELLGRVKEAALGAQGNQDIPFEQVVERVQPARSLAYTPLFQVMFAWGNTSRGELDLPGLDLAAAGQSTHVTAKFDVSLSLREAGGRIAGGVEYATALFDRATVERYVDYLRRVLEEMVADDTRAVDRLPMLPAAERRRVVEEWNDTAVEYPRGVCVHQLFERQVERAPHAVALARGSERVTYAELNARANRLARHLRALGVGPDARVGICVERGVEMVVGLLATLKAGGAYVPLDPAYPAERLRYMLRESAPVALLAQPSLRTVVDDLLAGTDLPVVGLDAEAWGDQSPDNLPPGDVGLTARHLAYVIYTSGSTGQPKGAMIEHASVCNLVATQVGQLSITPESRVLQFASFSFDGCVFEWVLALCNGASLCLPHGAAALVGDTLVDTVAEYGVTHAIIPPAVLAALPEGARMDSVHTLLATGEAPAGSLLNRWMEGRRVINGYGPTEATVCSTLHTYRARDVRNPPIGRPVANVRVYILDPAGEPVPVGVAGELYIGGAGVARGYLNRPELTAERFLDDPFSPGGRMYRTGDLGRWLADGTIEFLGRNDHQVKLRGFRVEPGEIEARLAAHPAVREAAVVVREDVAGDRRLVAYWVGDTVEVEALRGHVAERLPEYMVPSAYVRLDALPLTPNGKLDRRGLPAPEGDAYAVRGYEAPVGETEEALAEIWAEVLRVERVGRRDHFFELGGHSLLAVTLIERMRQRGLEADVRALFTTPTLAELAASVGGASRAAAVPANGIPAACTTITPEMLPLADLTQAQIDAIVATVPGGAANVQDIYPLAPLQEGMLFHHLLASEGDPYVLGHQLSFDSRALLDRYVEALQAVVARHDILRTAIVWEGLPEPVQVVWRSAPLPVEEVEVEAGGDVAAELSARFDPRRHRMDVRQAPLLRACAAHDPANTRWVLLVRQHHMAGDHTTLDVLRDEVEAHLLGRGHELPPALPFRNLVAQTRLGISREEHEAFFREMLADVEEPTASFGSLDVYGDGSSLDEASLRVDDDLAARLRGRARALGVSAASLCHVAWAQVLARVSGRRDVVFGTVLFGRMQGGEGADRVVGPFINTLPLRVTVGQEGAEEGVRRTHRLLSELLRHEHASLALAQRCSGVPAPTPLFTSVFNYRHGGAQPAAPRAAHVWEGMRSLRVAERGNYPLAFSVDDLGTGFGLKAHVEAPVRAARVCALMHQALEGLVDALEHAPASPLARIDVLPEAERRLVVEEWNATDAEYPRDLCVQQLFERQVERTPDAEAVVFGAERLTYAQLNARANRLAHHLRGLGVGPDVRVAICVDRGPEMIVGLLATLKAGGAYVPLDPAYPADRLQYMLHDSAPAVLLTQSWLGGVFARTGVRVLELDAAAPAWADAPASDPERGELTPEHLAYVIYTSGSTGTPKGVMAEHRGVVNLALAQSRAFALEAGSRVLQFASFSFDACVSEVVTTLCSGAVLHLPPRGEVQAGDALAATIERGGITHVTLPPAVLASLGDAPLAPVRTLVLAGEAMTAAMARRWGGGRLLINAYGPTEATVCATMHACAADEPGSPPIGRPMDNVRVYILDGAGEPVPVGVPGELYIGGAGVARGYLNRPELTAERFVENPFHGGRMYRTGDVGRWLPDGTVEFLGRNDHQVKLRGYRIELGEIEARLAAHPAIREAVAVVREDVPGDRRLVAYLVGEAVDAEALRAHVMERLPEYMVPSAYVRLDALPLNPNGKLDRRALSAPGGDAFAVRGYEPPVGDAEEVLAGIWAEVLGVEQVGRRDDFFDLGGHSLLAVQVVSRIRQLAGAEIAVQEMFAHPVLADFARIMEAAARTELPPIGRASREERLPLSFAQQRLWFLEQMGSGGRVYHSMASRRLRGELHQDALVRALDRIVERHEVLRTTFHSVDGEPEQRVAPAAESRFHLTLHDLSGRPEAELQALMEEEAGAPFDLERGPLIRGRLVKLGDDEHVLRLTMHHIVSDGWSMGVLVDELSALYTAFREGRPDPLPPLPVQYADYAAWQRAWVDGEVLREQAEYWKQTLTGAPELLELPTDRPRPQRQDHSGAALELELDEELTAGLKALSQRHGTTLFMTLLAGWSVVLSRLSGQRDVVIGTPSANRGRGEIEGLIGFFVNTLAVRVDLSGPLRVSELLERVKERALGAQARQDIPFEQVVELVQPARSLAHTPLFQVMFSWGNNPRGDLDLPGLKPAPAGRTMRAMAKFDLSLSLQEAGGRIAGGLVYATALFDAATMERHLGYLRRVLREMVAGDAQAVDRLPMLSAAERRQVLEDWNATDTEYPRDLCVQQLFEAQVQRTPDAEALVFGAERLTYAELNARANRLAHHLRATGVGPDARVAICLERSPEMVVAVLAVLKAGGAYVPLDPTYPAERLRYMLHDSAPAVLLAQSSLTGLFPGVDVPVLELDAAVPAWADAPASDPERGELTPEHLAYVIYTSGSTGQPKGVMNQHRTLVNRLSWLQSAWGLEAGEAVLGQTSLGFDGHVRELLWPLSAGGRVVLLEPGAQRDVERLLGVVRAEGISTLNLVPSLLQLLLEHGELSRCGMLRRVVCTGEALPPALLARCRETLPGVAVHNVYGPSEAATALVAPHCERWEGGAVVPIGRPIANTRVYLLDAAGEPVPVGVAGELYIGGAGVSRGYLNRPDLTAERFLEDPFRGGRMYRTGDFGRWLPNATVEFLGRNDAQVKIRGYRVELGEVEARLAGHASVREAVALVREDVPGDKRLVAYVVGDEGATAEALRAHMAERVPEYMVPSAYVRLDALPLTPNGKLDRRALPEPEGDAYAMRGYEAPVGETEQALAEIWAELLGVEQVGRRDSFFELGGHSLLAVQVVSRVRQALGAEIAIRELFAEPVLADFARVLEAASRTELPPIGRASREGRLPLSFAQQRLWFLEQMGSGGRVYHIPTGLRLLGRLDEEALRRALDRIVERHEVLRTTFHIVDGEPEQRIAPAGESRFHLTLQDLGGRSEAELQALMEEEMGAPFDLEHGPLIRGRLIRLGAEDHVLRLTMHHVVSDGWSMGVLVNELSALYTAFHRGEPDPLAPLPVQYADYAAWQRAWVEGEVLREQAEYWKQALTGAPELLELPTDRPRPRRQDHAAAAVELELDEALTAGLKALSRRHGTTLFMTLLAGWSVVLSRLSGQREVVIGTPSANRGRAEIEGLIGFFVNTLALRMDLSGAPTVAELLERVKERALGAQARQDIPFEQVVELVQPARSLARTPLFQVLFSWGNNPRGDLELPGLKLASAGKPARATAKFDLSLSLQEAGGRISGGLVYATALYDAATIERHLGYLRRVLEEMVADDAQALDRLPMLADAERRQVVEEWNATDAEYPRDLCVQQLFEAQVARTPEAEALAFGAERLTYAELNARANRLAHHLCELGVGPDVRVAICLERGPEMVVAVLAVLKAGGAYVPLDPTYPAERLQYMLHDSAPAVLLTQGSLGGLFAAVDVPVLELDAPAWMDEPASNPDPGALTPEHLAYVIYTSGSTGQPKGVMNPHRTLVNRLTWAQSAWGLEAGEAVLGQTSLGFDGHVRELLWPLCAGGRVVLLEPGAHRDVDHLLGVVRAEGVSTLNLVPSLLQLLLEHAELSRCGGLRRVVCGGEALPAALLGRCREVLPGVSVHNLYGPSEAATALAALHCEGWQGGAVVPIGRPIANTRVYLLDAAGEPVPVGVAGELFIGGAGVSRGYLNRAELTAERFVENPFHGGRMYRTGDFGRWLPDGTIEFLGRNDAQVKIRGYRVELGEVEARLAGHASVREAVALVREDVPGDKRLVAYVVGDEDATAEALRAHMAERLPEYMVPSAYVRLDALPLTPNGKLDRRALPAPEGDAYAVRGYEAPVGEAEEALAEIWAEVLGVERVGRRDNFFELGGHSLLAVTLIERMRKRGLNADVRTLFTTPTLAELAAAADGAARVVEVPENRISAPEGEGMRSLKLTI